MKTFSLIGPQVLPESMIGCGFHYRDAVKQKIESIRNQAADSKKDFNAMLRERPQDAILLARGHSNTLSILGSRGSGKTSIIMTLQRLLGNNGDTAPDLREPDFSNIMMPFLVPQDMAREQPLLSWVINQLLRKADEIEKDLQDHYYGDPICGVWQDWGEPQKNGPRSDPFQYCKEKLLAAFDLRCRNDHWILPDEGDRVYYYMDSVKRDAELLTNMLRLISMMMDYYRYKIRASSANSPREPLLFFTIDDLDLAPERSSEVLNLVLRYLQHPNVVIICGWNHELFQNHLSMDLLRTQGVMESSQLDVNFSFADVFMQRYRKRTTALDSARRLALDNLKKAFPPAQRYEIRSLSIEERACFPYALDSLIGENDPESLFQLIEKTILQCAHDSAPDKSKNTVGFLHNDKGEDLYIYTRIFDNKARGLTNTYRAFEALLESQRTPRNGEWEEDITASVKVLLETILFSTTRFAPYRRGLRDLIQIKKVVVSSDPKKRHLEYYCDFRAAKEILNQYEEERQQKISIEETANFYLDAEHFIEQKYDYFPYIVIDVFLLMNFMENFLRRITGRRASTHGGKEFSALLNQLRPPIDFTSRTQDLLTQAVRVGGVQRLKLFPDTGDFALNIAILNAYEQDGFEENRYHFTGFHSLERIFDMVSGLLLNQAGGLDSQKAEEVLKDDPEWLSSIMKVLKALQPKEENIKRLAAYTSILEILDAKREEEIEEAIKEAKSLHFSADNRLHSLSTNKDWKLSDNNLDILIKCLRTIDSNRKRFLPLRNKSTLKGSEEQQAVYYRAKKYLEDILWNWNGQPHVSDRPSIFIKSPSQFEENLKPLTNFRLPKDIGSEDFRGDIQIIVKALEKADDEERKLLSDIKARMQRSLQENYKKQGNDPEKQHAYLILAAIATQKYIERWELKPEKWGKREIEAATDLVSIFQRNFLETPVENVLEVLRLGPTLEQRGRDRYNILVEQLKTWVSSNNRYFTGDEQENIRIHLMTLSNASKQIPRNLGTEVNLYNAVREIGRLVAQEFGEVSYELFEKWKNDKEKRILNEKQLTIWPVSMDHNEKLGRLYCQFKPLIPEEAEPATSLFDVASPYSALYLRTYGK